MFQLGCTSQNIYPCVTAEGRVSTKELRTQKLRQNGVNDSFAFSSYRENSEKERLCEAIVDDNIRHILKERPDLHRRCFVMVENEFGVTKCVCSTLKPTLLPYPELYDSCDIAIFVARLLEYEPLEDSRKPPNIMPSPSQVLDWGVGDCFDFSTVLTSFLLGSGYDAYVVYGEAPEWLCNRDRSHSRYSYETLLYPDEIREMKEAISSMIAHNVIEESSTSTYSCRENCELTSCCTTSEAGCSLDSSSLSSRKVHCWVLVRSNKRSLPSYPNDYFIEPSTGERYEVSSCPYLFVHAVWNDKNYWVNTNQDKGRLEATSSFNLKTEDGWFAVFNSLSSNNHDRLQFDPPLSWVKSLSSSSEESVLNTYKNSVVRVLLCDRMKIELYSDGVQRQGIEKKIIQFEDKELIAPIQILECFGEFRSDGLLRRLKFPRHQAFNELYRKTNKYAIKEWLEVAGEKRIINFYPRGRPDGLVSIHEVFGKKAVHTYNNRHDNLSQIIVDLVWADERVTKTAESLVLPSGDGTQNAIATRIT